MVYDTGKYTRIYENIQQLLNIYKSITKLIQIYDLYRFTHRNFETYMYFECLDLYSGCPAVPLQCHGSGGAMALPWHCHGGGMAAAVRWSAMALAVHVSPWQGLGNAMPVPWQLEVDSKTNLGDWAFPGARTNRPNYCFTSVRTAILCRH